MVPTNMETDTLTGFVNEACDQVSVRGAGYTRLTEMYTDTTVVTDVKDYFSRPKLINTITYGNLTTPLLTIGVTNSYLQSTLYNFSRVLGAFGYRATVCFRLQAVSNPFQAGIIRMAFSPFQEPNEGAYYDRTLALTPVSQLPGVELDLAESTSCVLKIPFIHPYNYFYVSTPETAHYEKLGDLVVFPYTPVVLGTGATQPSLALWLWLEDFELISATCATYTSQSGMPRNKAASSKEADKIPGNLSNVLAAGSHLATWLGTKIPLISSYAGPTSWFMRQASHIAASYGWSRPIAVTVPNKVVQTDNVYQNNSDGPDPSFALGLFSDNAIAPLPGFAGAAVDEMSFDYIKSVYACVSFFGLNTTQASGSYVKAVQLSPSAMFYQTGTLVPAPVTFFPNGYSGLSIWPSPVFALANAFGKWRGGFKFRVKIAKTKFHTGRLILGFTPAQTSTSLGAAVPADPTNMQFKSAIWDLREGNTFEFECPFTSPYSYLQFTDNYGSFFISVLEPLAGPSTVAQTVPCLIEVAGMDDFEVACPQPPALPLAPQATLFVAQSGLSSVLRDSASEHPSVHCIGEKINSVKQMITRAGIVGFSAASGYFTYIPNIVLPQWNNVITPTTLNGVNKTYFNYFSAFFMMSRGGYHLHAVPVGKDVTLCATNFDIFRLTGSSFVTESATALHVKVPYYNTRSRDIVPDTTGQYGNISRAQISYSMPGSGTQSVIISARAADDFQFGYFVGAPPLAVPFVDGSSLDASVRSALIGTH